MLEIGRKSRDISEELPPQTVATLASEAVQ
jgi:hypothetical protein